MSIAPGFGTWEQRYHNAQWEAQQLREQLAAVTKERDELVDFCIWLTGCGYDFTQHDYFIRQRDRLLKNASLAKLDTDKTGEVG